MHDKLETTAQTEIICVTVDWDNDQIRDTLRYRFIGMWEWYDFSQASMQAFRMMSEVSHDVSVIFDMRLSLDIPVGALRAIRRFLQFSPPNMDIVVVASDDRPEFCTPEAVPAAHEFFPVPLADLPQQFEITPWTYLVLTTRGANVDVAGLPALLDSPAAYIGVIGSQRRWLTTLENLRKAGVPEEKLRRVRSPMGLELNAETPEEIAVSILAEIIMLRNGGDGKVMRLTTQP